MTFAVVFGGGGARGAFQAGAWSELGGELSPRFVIGTSIGALNALATTRLNGADILSWWEERAPDTLWPNPGERFAALAKQLLALPVIHDWPVLVVTTRLNDLQARVTMLHGSRAKQTRWVAASGALPGVIAPVRIGSHWYADGGLRNDLAVDIAKDIGATQTLALSASGWGRVPPVQADFTLAPPSESAGVLNFSPKARESLLLAGVDAAIQLRKNPLFQQKVLLEMA